MSDPRQKGKRKSVRKENERKENERAKAYYNRHQLRIGDDALMKDEDISDEDFAPASAGNFKRNKRLSDVAKEVKSAIHHGGGSRDIDKSQRPSSPKRQKQERLPQKHQSERPGYRQGQVDNQKKHEAELVRRAEEQHRLEQQSRRDAEAARMSERKPASGTIAATPRQPDPEVSEEIISPSMQAAITIKSNHSAHELYVAHIFDMNNLGAAEAQQELLQNLAQLCKDDSKFKNSWDNPGNFYGKVNTQLGHLRGVITILQKNRQKRINDFQASRPQTTPKKIITSSCGEEMPSSSWMRYSVALTSRIALFTA